MEGTEPHEILNKVVPRNVFSKKYADTLVGMHDECYEYAKRDINFEDYCEICEQPKNRHNNKICYNRQLKDMEW
jgi:hypothetical protein